MASKPGSQFGRSFEPRSVVFICLTPRFQCGGGALSVHGAIGSILDLVRSILVEVINEK